MAPHTAKEVVDSMKLAQVMFFATISLLAAPALSNRPTARAATEPGPVVDPVVEEPIRPLFPDSQRPTRSPADQCGPMGLPVLLASLLLWAVPRFARSRMTAPTPICSPQDPRNPRQAVPPH
jgi:hypothetical protein